MAQKTQLIVNRITGRIIYGGLDLKRATEIWEKVRIDIENSWYEPMHEGIFIVPTSNRFINRYG